MALLEILDILLAFAALAIPFAIAWALTGWPRRKSNSHPSLKQARKSYK